MLMDLHTHTTASDGQYDSTEMVHMAIRFGLRYYAITDHDTVEGIQDALDVSKSFTASDFYFIPGIEISTQDVVEIHIVGLGIRHDEEKLRKMCDKFKQDRDGRGIRICSYLKSKNVTIEYNEVKELAGKSNLCRPHFAAYLVSHGYVTDINEAFNLFLDTAEFHEAVDRILPRVEQSIELIHGAGGLAILAHPGLYKLNSDELQVVVKECKEKGLDGIECYYSQHTKKQTEDLLRLADKYEELVSCGSDFHGERIKPHIKFGMDVDDYEFGNIKTLLDKIVKPVIC